MNPNTILIIMLTIVCMRPFFEVPEATKKAAALRLGGYKPNPNTTAAYLLLAPVLLALWWWYAISADVLLLGIIPTAGFFASWIAHTVEASARKSAARGRSA